MKENVLVSTLGVTAPVISETINLLEAEGKSINKLVVVHTSFKDVLHKQTPSGKDIGLVALKEYIGSKHGNIAVESIDLGIEDILTENDNTKVLHILMNAIEEERNKQNTVYVSIAGGRKTMSAAALFAAYAVGCDGIYHVLVNGREEELTDAYGFDVPLDKLTLIRIPPVNLSPMLKTVIEEIDTNNLSRGDISAYLQDKERIEEVFSHLNDGLRASLDLRKLHEEHNRRYSLYERMNQTVLAILQARIRKSAVMKPQYESRVKTFESFIRKIAEKRGRGETFQDPFERIHDLSAVRIVTYFQEDLDTLEKMIDGMITERVDFEPYPDPDKAKKIKKPEVVGYTGIHYLVGLRPDRTALLEYEELSGLWCEIQLKTIFDHAWSQVDHRLRFKSEEFHAMSKEQKDEVLAVFADAARLLNESKAVFSTLRETYEHFRKET